MAAQWTFTNVKIYEPELDHYLNAPDGEVGKYLAARGRAMVIAAKRQVGVDTGELRESIHMIHERVGRTQQLWIGSTVGHALEHHEGTRPHVITPNTQPMLRFSSGGRVIYTRRVLHPGTRPNHYLSDQLVLVRV